MAQFRVNATEAGPLAVLVVNGPSQDRCDRFFGWPTSLLYAVSIAHAAEASGSSAFNIQGPIFDPVWYVKEDNGAELDAEFLSRACGCDLILFSTTYDSLYPVLRWCEKSKHLPNAPITVVGGPYVDETLRAFGMATFGRYAQSVDIGVAGDGEYVVSKICEVVASRRELAAEDLSPLPGRSIVTTHEWTALTRGDLLDLDALPNLPVQLADMNRHVNDFDVFRNENRVKRTVQMIAGRGCAYSCSFCSERRQLAPPNARSVSNVLQEIDLRIDQGFEAVFFDDSTFGRFPRVEDLLRGISERNVECGGLNRFDCLQSPVSVALLSKAGFSYVYCAVEQADDDALRSVHKGLSVAQMERALELLKEHGIRVGVSLLYGLPGESPESVDRTLEFVARWVDDGVIVLVSESVLAFHPGTPIVGSRQLRFDCPPPNPGYPFDRFEEGQWYHEPFVTAEYLDDIYNRSCAAFGSALVRKRHSWYMDRGIVCSSSSGNGAS